MVRIHHFQSRLGTLSTICLVVLLLAACSPTRKRHFDPSKVAFTATSNPLLDTQIYPSLLLALGQSETSPRTSNLAPFTLSLTAPSNNAVLRVVIDSSALNYVTILQEILPMRGETYTFTPAVKWKYERLRHIRTPQRIDLTLTCYINDEEVDVKNLHLTARPTTECPLSFSHNGNVVDTRWLFAAYVNEDHPYIDQILSDILTQGTVSRFTGYQTGRTTDVDQQAFAVWHYALSQGLTYSSITCTSNPSPHANVQHIRLFDQVYNSRQANCVDACVFFASILRKIGLQPIIFVEPCHAYLGYYTDRKKKNIHLIETTITSWVNYPQIIKNMGEGGRITDSDLNNLAKYISPEQLESYQQGNMSTDQLLLAVSHSLFDKAQQYNVETFTENRQHFADSAAITFQQLDIEQLRTLVQPIN